MTAGEHPIDAQQKQQYRDYPAEGMRGTRLSTRVPSAVPTTTATVAMATSGQIAAISRHLGSRVYRQPGRVYEEGDGGGSGDEFHS